ncbi:tetratricopeptide repeat protein [Desulfurivibrio sp. D14AmB]|uniref:tetratricopeptide repeat protein n=1 Tax=Desulfurivibrio sp. D14AmB TaxID=3374370 RepID=UPI00376ED9CB
MALPDEHHTLLLALLADNSTGSRLFGERWPELAQALRRLLRQDSLGEPEARGEILLFRYPNPAAALKSWSTRLLELKKRLNWEPLLGPIPLRLILDLENDNGEDVPPQLTDPTGGSWQELQAETIHLSPALGRRWAELADPQKLGTPSPVALAGGLTALIPAAPKPQAPPLFPHRRLPLGGKFKPCFYCGQTTHQPADCPGKMLTMQTQGLPTAGYLPLEQLAQLFREAMEGQGQLNPLLVTGVDHSQLRKTPLLHTYVTYFDLNKVFQPRFLAAIAFSTHSQWEELGRPESINVENNNLFLGLDCLRVGQYHRANELFIAEGRRPRGKELYATIGRAFISLEQNRHQDMEYFLESALKMAISNRDRIYLCLLLTRHYRLMEEPWKASQALDNILTFQRDCLEALYLQVQLAVDRGLVPQALEGIRSLVEEERTFFIQALMDPELTPIQGEVEEILRSRLRIQAQEAEERLAQARVTCEEMELWLEENDPGLKTLRGDLAIIEGQAGQQSYFDLVDVAEKSRSLVINCHRTQEARLDALHDRLTATGRRLEEFRRLWRDYPHRPFFPSFAATLAKVGKAVAKAAGEGTKNMHGALYRALINSLEECDRDFALLTRIATQMAWLRTLFQAGKQFLRSLVVAEIALLSFTLILLVALIMLAADSPTASGLAQMLRDPALQKRLLTLVTLVLAPIFALIHTLWRTLEQL